jgi:hypothetical protein
MGRTAGVLAALALARSGAALAVRVQAGVRAPWGLPVCPRSVPRRAGAVRQCRLPRDRRAARTSRRGCMCVCVCVSQLADYHAFQDLAVCGAQPCCACSAELCREGLGLQRAPLACRTAPCPCTR